VIARAVVGNRDFARDMGSSGTPDKRSYPAFAKMSQQHSTPWRDDPGADACMGWAETRSAGIAAFHSRGGPR
jgi:hypothetical protein